MPEAIAKVEQIFYIDGKGKRKPGKFMEVLMSAYRTESHTPNKDRILGQINSCPNPRAMLMLLALLLEPRSDQIEKSGQKVSVGLGNVLPNVSEAKRT